MTLIAGFRSREGGVLLCTDREEMDGYYSKRSVDKVYTLRLNQVRVYVAGAGAASIIIKAFLALKQALTEAEANGEDLWFAHAEILESSLEKVYSRYVKSSEQEIGLLIVVAFYGLEKPVPPPPFFYRTEHAMVLPAGNYAAQGTGRIIADYLADKLYRESLDRVVLTNLAVFIFREAASVSSGVGLGTDTIMIFEGDRSLHSISGGAIRELEDCIPKLGESIYAHWEGHLRAPEWLTETLTGPVAPSATPAAD